MGEGLARDKKVDPDVRTLSAAVSLAALSISSISQAQVQTADSANGNPAGALVAAGAAAATAAQDDGVEIIVTGRSEGYLALDVVRAAKTDTPLRDIPQAISVVTREQLDDQAMQDLGDVLRYTPGVSINQGEGHRDQITIRGQNTTADFFVDGIRDDIQYFRPLYNLERVEILKGSNALLFGRGGGGGVINRVTRSPVLGESFGGGTFSVDTFGAFALTGDANASLSESAAVRVNAVYEEYDNHRDFFGGDRFAVNPTLGFAPGEDTRLLFSYEYVDDQRTVDRGVPAMPGGIEGDPVGPVRGFRDTFFGDPDANLTTFEGHILRGRLIHDFTEDLRYDLTVHYADYDKLYRNLYPVGSDPVGGTVTLDGYRDTTQRENFIVQGNLLWTGETGAIGHTLLAGYEYGDQQSDNARRDVFFADSMDDQISFAFSDPLMVPAFSFPVNVRQSMSDVEFLSFYIQDQISIGDHFDIVAGIRYDRFEIEVDDIQNGLMLGRTDTEWSPRLGLIYKPIEPVSLYISYTRTFLPRAGDQFLNLTPSDATLAPERFDNYEIGAKWDVTPDIRLSAAIFRLDRENGVVADPNDPGNAILTGSRTEGFEAQLTGEILPGWQVNAGYSYLDADERGRLVGTMLANRTIGNVPRHQFSLWNRYDIDQTWGVGGGVTHQSSQFASLSNAVRLPSFTRFDAALYVRLTDAIEAQVNIENLFDERYFPAAHNDNNISTGEPFNARFTLRARF